MKVFPLLPPSRARQPRHPRLAPLHPRSAKFPQRHRARLRLRRPALPRRLRAPRHDPLRPHARAQHRQQLRKPTPPGPSASRVTPTSFSRPDSWHGSHQLRAGIDVDHIRFTENVSYAPVQLSPRRPHTRAPQASSLSSRLSPATTSRRAPGWKTAGPPRTGLLIEPGLRFDWDEIIRRPLWSPRIAFNYSPPGAENTTLSPPASAIYYEHTQLEYLTRALAGIRYDTYYAAGRHHAHRASASQPHSPKQCVRCTKPRALNWSVGLQHKLPGQIYLGANFMQKRHFRPLRLRQSRGPGALSGNYLSPTTARTSYHSVEFDARRTFRGSYALFGSYTRSSATTDSALDYVPTIPLLGPQQSGPLFWDVPNRVISWGWLPAWAPFLPIVHKNWDFVYTLDWNTGFPFDSINANEQIVGPAGSHRFPDLLSLQPRPRMALPLPWQVLRPARHRRKHHRRSGSLHRLQQCRFARST